MRRTAEIISEVVQDASPLVASPIVRHSERGSTDSTVATLTGLSSNDVIRIAGLEPVWGEMTQADIDRTTDESWVEHDLQIQRECNEDWFGHGENGILSGPVGTTEEVVVERALDRRDNDDSEGFDTDIQQEDLPAAEPPPLRVYAVRLVTDVDADERGLDPVTVLQQGSLRSVGSRAMLADVNSMGGFHVGELNLRDERGSRRGLDPEMERNWDNVGLDGMEPEAEVDDVEDLALDGAFPQALVEESELELAAMERALTQADLA